MSQEKTNARTIYNGILKEYETVLLNNCTVEEKTVANKIKTAINDIALSNSNPGDPEIIKTKIEEDFEKVISQILNGGVYTKESLSKIMSLILFEKIKEEKEFTKGPRINRNFYAIRSSSYEKLFIKFIGEDLVDLNYTFSNNSTIFHFLIIFDEPYHELLKLAIQHNYNVNIKDTQGNTIVHLAISCPHCAESLESLLKLLGDKFNYNAVNNIMKNIYEYYKFILQSIDCATDKMWYYALSKIDRPWLGYDKGYGYNYLEKLIKNLIPSTRAFFIKDENLKSTLNKLNHKINRLITFLNFSNLQFIPYVVNPNDTNESLRNQIDERQRQLEYLKEEALKYCFPGYENDILEFILNGTITPTFNVVYSTLLARHGANINKELLMLPLTQDKIFLIFTNLFKLECRYNKVVGDVISRKLEVTSH